MQITRYQKRWAWYLGYCGLAALLDPLHVVMPIFFAICGGICMIDDDIHKHYISPMWIVFILLGLIAGIEGHSDLGSMKFGAPLRLEAWVAVPFIVAYIVEGWVPRRISGRYAHDAKEPEKPIPIISNTLDA